MERAASLPPQDDPNKHPVLGGTHHHRSDRTSGRRCYQGEKLRYVLAVDVEFYRSHCRYVLPSITQDQSFATSILTTTQPANIIACVGSFRQLFVKQDKNRASAYPVRFHTEYPSLDAKPGFQRVRTRSEGSSDLHLNSYDSHRELAPVV